MIKGWITHFLLASSVIVLVVSGCNLISGYKTVELNTVPPTPPSTIQGVIEALSSDYPEVRISAALSVHRFGENSVDALPALRENLFYERSSDVRRSAAVALELIGPDACIAVSDLIDVLLNDDNVNVRSAAAKALGEIGSGSSVPSLVSVLYENDSLKSHVWFKITAAEAVTSIIGKTFSEPDADLINGIPPIVIEVQKWWENAGKYKSWEDCADEELQK